MEPFVVVLEGVNGTGKTTIARLLGNAYRFSHNARVFRTFQEAKDGSHKALELASVLKDAGIPLNTHIDDFYAADSIRSLLGPDDMVILDRSLPSGLAYARSGVDRSGTVVGDSRSIANADQIARDASNAKCMDWIRHWSSMIPNHLYVTLLVSYDESRRRAVEQSRTRWHPSREQHERLEANFRALHAMVPGSKALIETDFFTIDHVIEKITKLIPAPRYADLKDWHANPLNFKPKA